MKKKLNTDFKNSVFVSAKTGEDFDSIENEISKILAKRKQIINLNIPNSAQKIINKDPLLKNYPKLAEKIAEFYNENS